MIYGDVKFDASVDENLCKDVNNVDFNDENNCTTIAIPSFSRFDLTAYTLYQVTFGQGLDEESMNNIDNQMKNLLIAIYVGLTSLVSVNIFIALLSATFNR